MRRAKLVKISDLFCHLNKNIYSKITYKIIISKYKFNFSSFEFYYVNMTNSLLKVHLRIQLVYF